MAWYTASTTDGVVTVGETVTSMKTETVTFLGEVITNFWGLFLSLALLAFAGVFILRKTGIGRR